MFKKSFVLLQLIVGIFFTLIFLISLHPNFEIQNYTIYNIGLLSFLVLILLLIKRILNPTFLKRVNVTTLFALCFLGGLYLPDFTGNEKWEPKEVLFHNGQFSSQTIEFQIKRNEVGQSTRIVKVVTCLDVLNFYSSIDTAGIGLPWLPAETIENP